MGQMNVPADNGSVTWVPLHVTALAAVAEQDEGMTIRARKLRDRVCRWCASWLMRADLDWELLLDTCPSFKRAPNALRILECWGKWSREKVAAWTLAFLPLYHHPR